MENTNYQKAHKYCKFQAYVHVNLTIASDVCLISHEDVASCLACCMFVVMVFVF